MKVKLLSENAGQRDFAVIFSPGDDPYAGLTEFAQKYDVKSAHFTAIGDFRDVKLGWFDMQKKMFRVNPVNQRVEVGFPGGRYRAARRQAFGAHALRRSPPGWHYARRSHPRGPC
jgi:hypothetical protein